MQKNYYTNSHKGIPIVIKTVIEFPDLVDASLLEYRNAMFIGHCHIWLDRWVINIIVPIINNNNLTNKSFVFACDLLKLKEYKEFEESKISKNYWKLDNCLMVTETLQSNDVNHYKYIEQYIEVKNIEHLIYYCCYIGSFQIMDYLMMKCNKKLHYNVLAYISVKHSLYFIKKYSKLIKVDAYMLCQTIKYKNLDNVKWILDKIKYVSDEYMDNVNDISSDYGTIEILNYLYTNMKNFKAHAIFLRRDNYSTNVWTFHHGYDVKENINDIMYRLNDRLESKYDTHEYINEHLPMVLLGIVSGLKYSKEEIIKMLDVIEKLK